jgi:RimJ/RimL family protein N-acetyltransferase
VALRKSISVPIRPAPTGADWTRGLPELADDAVTLRELRTPDASSLVAHLYDAQVLKYVAPCPPSVAGFVRFIEWAHRERRRGGLACYGIVPRAEVSPVGVMQLWPIERDFSTAEWGFVLGRAFWGAGVFSHAATLMLDDLFPRLGVYRLEARAVATNRRGNRALEKLGAKRDGLLRGSFRDGSVIRSHVMWSILAPEWQASRRLVRHAV